MENHFQSFDFVSATSGIPGGPFLTGPTCPSLTGSFASPNGSGLGPLPMPFAPCPILPEPSQSDDSSLAWFNAAGILLSLKHAAIERSSRLETYNDELSMKMSFSDHETPVNLPQDATHINSYPTGRPEDEHVLDMRLALGENRKVWDQGPGTQASFSGSIAGESENKCRICNKVYARPSTLRTHMRTHKGEKPFKCQICLKSFTQDANLTAHLRIHSGEKPFKCQVCERRFAQSSSVTTHMRTHTGERPYMCRVCSRAFADSSTLTKHLRTHTGEKPYQCKVCQMRFSQSGNLNRHMRVHATH